MFDFDQIWAGAWRMASRQDRLANLELRLPMLHYRRSGPLFPCEVKQCS
jgi:hypothetical protein